TTNRIVRAKVFAHRPGEDGTKQPHGSTCSPRPPASIGNATWPSRLDAPGSLAFSNRVHKLLHVGAGNFSHGFSTQQRLYVAFNHAAIATQGPDLLGPTTANEYLAGLSSSEVEVA